MSTETSAGLFEAQPKRMKIGKIKTPGTSPPTQGILLKSRPGLKLNLHHLCSAKHAQGHLSQLTSNQAINRPTKQSANQASTNNPPQPDAEVLDFPQGRALVARQALNLEHFAGLLLSPQKGGASFWKGKLKPPPPHPRITLWRVPA